MTVVSKCRNKKTAYRLLIIVSIPLLLFGLSTGVATAQDTSNLNIGEIDAPVEVSVNEEANFESNAEIPNLPADWSAELEFILYENKGGGASRLGTQEVTVEDGESVDISIEHEFQEAGSKQLYFQINGEITREGRISSQTATIDRQTRQVTTDVPGELDPENIDISSIDLPSEVSPQQAVEVESRAEIPELPADWSANLNFVLYVNDEQVGTREINIQDGESVYVAIEHEFQGVGNKEVYYEVTGDVTRQGPVATQTAEIDRTTQSVTVGVLDDLNVNEIDIRDFSAPSEITLDEQIEPEVTVEIPDLPANWDAELEFALYSDGNEVATQEVNVEDGEEVDVSFEHDFSSAGSKEVYYEVTGDVERNTDVATQSASIDRTSRVLTVSVDDPPTDTSDTDTSDTDTSDTESTETDSSDSSSTSSQNGDDGGTSVEIPGFGIVHILSAFGGVAYLITSRISKNKRE